MIVTAMLTLACGLLSAQFSHLLGSAPVVGAILCAACFLKPRELWIIGLGGMLIRDLLMGPSLYTLVRLAGIGGVVAVVLMLRVRPNLRSLIAGLLLASPIYHLVLAVGDWATGTCGVWPKNFPGLSQAVVSAFPYFQRSFVGDVLFSGFFLALYTLAAYVASGLRREQPAR